MKVQYLLANGDFQVHKAGCRDIDKLLRRSDYEEPIDADFSTEYEAIHDLYEDQISEQAEPEAEKLTVRFLHDHGYAGSVRFAPCVTLTPLPGPNGLPEKEPAMATNGTRISKSTTRPARQSAVKPSPSEARAAEKLADTQASHPRPTRAARTTQRSPKPGGTKTIPARKTAPRGAAKTAAVVAQSRARRQAALPPPEPEPAASTGGVPLKRAAKRELALQAIIALDDMLKNLEDDNPIFTGMDDEEAARTVSQWVHHFPTGGDWPAELLPKPERSNWR